MGYAILRIANRKTTRSVARMVRHSLREDKVPNAVEGAPKPQNGAAGGYGHASSKEAMTALYSKIEAAKTVRAGWQKSSTAALDILITASREDMLAWDLPKQNRFFAKALEFVVARFGGKQNVLVASIHRDESTPHMQILLAPVNAEGRFSASKMVGGRDQLSQLQTDFHEVCGQPFDLQRGVQRTKAKHVPVRAFYGAMENGLEPPAYVTVPLAPTMLDNLKGTYKAKKTAHDAALAQNSIIRQEVDRQAQRGRTVHPKVIERQAEKYRSAVRLEALAEKQTKEAAQTRLEARAARSEVDQRVSAAEQAGAIAVAKLSKNLTVEAVADLSMVLGVQLRPGRDLCDELRDLGLADNVVDAAKLLDAASNGRLRVQIEPARVQVPSRDYESPRPDF